MRIIRDIIGSKVLGIFFLGIVILLINCSYVDIYVEEWDDAFIIDSVTIGALRRSYELKTATGGWDVKPNEYTDPELALYTYNIETMELKKEKVLTDKVGETAGNNSSECIYVPPYLVYFAKKGSDQTNAFMYNRETGENMKMFSIDHQCLLTGVSSKAKRIFFDRGGACTMYDVEKDSISFVWKYGFDPYIDHAFTNDSTALSYFYGGDYYLGYKQLYTLDLNTGDIDTIVDSLTDDEFYRIDFFSSDALLLIKSDPSNIWHYIPLSEFINNPDTAKYYENMPYITFTHALQGWNRRWGVSTSGVDIYIEKYTSTDTVYKILDGYTEGR